MGKLKLLLVSDLHGSNAAYMKLSNAPQFYGVKDVIFAGDLLGKALVPIIDMGDHYEANGEKIKKRNIDDAIKRIRNAGQYPFMTSMDEYEKIREDTHIWSGYSRISPLRSLISPSTSLRRGSAGQARSYT